jgi:hypothetical protein
MRYSSFIKVYDDVSESISKIQEWWNNNMDIEKWLLVRMMLSNLKDFDKKIEQTKDSIIMILILLLRFVRYSIERINSHYTSYTKW